jgi:MFS family permease
LIQFVTVRALEGLGETFYFPASMSLISDYHGASTRSRALSFHQSGVYAGTILGSWVGAVIAEKYNWRYGFYLFGMLGIVVSMALYKVLREPVRGESEPQGKFVPSTRRESSSAQVQARFAFLLNPTVVLLMAAFVCANSIATVFLVWTPTFLVEKFHFKLSAAGLSGQVYIQAASAIAVPLAGILADKLAMHMRVGRIAVQASGLLAGAVFVTIVGSATGVLTLLAAMTAFGFCKGFYDSGIFASLYDCVGPSARGSAAGLMNTAGWGGGALGPVLVGWISQHGRGGSQMANMSAAISFGGFIYVLGAVLLVLAGITHTIRLDRG